MFLINLKVSNVSIVKFEVYLKLLLEIRPTKFYL